MKFLNRSSLGLVYNSAAAPNCTYGFTDTVAKTGNVLFTSLLYYQAAQRMGTLARAAGCGDVIFYEGASAAIQVISSVCETIILALECLCRYMGIVCL